MYRKQFINENVMYVSIKRVLFIQSLLFILPVKLLKILVHLA